MHVCVLVCVYGCACVSIVLTDWCALSYIKNNGIGYSPHTFTPLPPPFHFPCLSLLSSFIHSTGCTLWHVLLCHTTNNNLYMSI